MNLWILNLKCRMLNAEWGLRYEVWGIVNLESWILNLKFWIFEFWILNLECWMRLRIFFTISTPYHCISWHPYLPYGKPISHTRQIWVSRKNKVPRIYLSRWAKLVFLLDTRLRDFLTMTIDNDYDQFHGDAEVSALG